jgi:hypothetical protein
MMKKGIKNYEKFRSFGVCYAAMTIAADSSDLAPCLHLNIGMKISLNICLKINSHSYEWLSSNACTGSDLVGEKIYINRFRRSTCELTNLC